MSSNLRDMVRETDLSVKDLIYPMFVNENLRAPKPIGSMPGVKAYPVGKAAAEAKSAEALGIPAVLLFGIPKRKDERGSEAWNEKGVVQRAIREIKKETDLTVIADLCLCEYTDHGHCGVLHGEVVDNDSTIELYGLTAIAQAEAGADIIAPSGMMDGQVGLIREALDDAGFESVPIMSYSAKYASAFYGPFRDAAESTPRFGDRRTHQMDPGNLREAMREMAADIDEGADILMVKPALPYLDVIREARLAFDLPIAAYNVSGEYAMVKAAAANGWLDHDRAMMESLLSIRRAGADMIITYFAKEAAAKLGEM
ncbi:porphobilinogen synthase [Methanomassiliicoccus luminyensis]|uniref:porphobilinogen synthase n=1 Tax=Methanomassiliicoccus luminyensis TaxID=1080712 RepID=UPI00036003A9|nr:porphobilinogen synthase [Methanomassiliicoccus luminyensis]